VALPGRLEIGRSDRRNQRDARVVHQNVDGAEPITYFGDHGGDARAIRDVEREGAGRAARSSNFVADARRARGVAVEHGGARALVRE